jgi:hypothetical protein
MGSNGQKMGRTMAGGTRMLQHIYLRRGASKKKKKKTRTTTKKTIDFLTQLYIQDTMAGGRQQESTFLKQEEVVLVNGRGFRYRLSTGELAATGAVPGEHRLIPKALAARRAGWASPSPKPKANTGTLCSQGGE